MNASDTLSYNSFENGKGRYQEHVADGPMRSVPRPGELGTLLHVALLYFTIP